MSYVVVIVVLVAAYMVYDMLRDWGTKGPLKYPIVGNFPQVAKYTPTRLDWFRDLFQTHGRTLLLRIFNVRIHLTSERDNAEYILKTNWKNFTVAHRQEMTFEYFGNGIVVVDGEMWEKQRKTTSREFTANRFRTRMGVVFAEGAQKLCTALSHNAKTQTPFDIAEKFFAFTMDSFGKIATGVELGCLDGKPNPFGPAMDRVFETLFARQSSHPAIWRTMRALSLGAEGRIKLDLAIINDFAATLIRERRAMTKEAIEERDDLMSRLVSLSDVGEHHDDKYLRDMLIVFLVGGRDTTAATMSWFLYLVASHPAVEQRLVEEIESQLGGTTPNLDNLKGCHYLQACMSETMRLYPSFPAHDRTVKCDDVLPSGDRLRAGDMILIICYAIARDPQYWGPDAATFRPERFLNAEGVYVRPEDPYTFCTFGGGPRNCIGMDMAYFQAKVAMCELFRRFKLRLVPGKRVHYTLGMMKIEGGLWVTAEPRK